MHRFPNGVVEGDGHLRWDLTGLVAEVRAGLDRIPDAESIGIDTWGVDYGLLDADGELLAEPDRLPRRPHRQGHRRRARRRRRPTSCSPINGLQFLPFTTLYQLVAEQRRARCGTEAAHVVLLPDLLAYWLTGELRTEVTNASTTGLVDVRTGDWSTDLLDRLGIPADLLPPIEQPGDGPGHDRRRRPGDDRRVARHRLGGRRGAGHHRALRLRRQRHLVARRPRADRPGRSPTQARAANFTNEGGVDGRTRFLRNVGGLWLLQESLRAWRRDDLDDLLAEAAALPGGGPIIDVDDPVFIPPGDMPERIAAAAGRRRDDRP